ncbi:2006_t:CDS:1, partial [Diversispora eburnea]
MPRVSRTIRAINHWNPVVGVIMFLQEKIRDLSRRVVNCPVLEAEVERLRMNLQTLEERLNSIRRERHRFEMERNELEWECSLLRRNIIQEWTRYLRDPARAYLQRFQLYEYEISYLDQ